MSAADDYPPYRAPDYYRGLSALALANELSAVEGYLGLSHYRGSRLTARENQHGQAVLAEARRRIEAS